MRSRRRSSCARRCCRRGSRRSATALGAAISPIASGGWRPRASCWSATPRCGLQHALDYMLGDEILGSSALTLPGFAKVADQLLARHHARSRRAVSPPAATTWRR